MNSDFNLRTCIFCGADLIQGYGSSDYSYSCQNLDHDCVVCDLEFAEQVQIRFPNSKFTCFYNPRDHVIHDGDDTSNVYVFNNGDAVFNENRTFTCVDELLKFIQIVQDNELFR